MRAGLLLDAARALWGIWAHQSVVFLVLIGLMWCAHIACSRAENLAGITSGQNHKIIARRGDVPFVQ